MNTTQRFMESAACSFHLYQPRNGGNKEFEKLIPMFWEMYKEYEAIPKNLSPSGFEEEFTKVNGIKYKEFTKQASRFQESL